LWKNQLAMTETGVNYGCHVADSREKGKGSSGDAERGRRKAEREERREI